jgi:hypothetical protein
VRPRPAQVGEDVGVGAAALFEGVGKDAHSRPIAQIVDPPGHARDGVGAPDVRSFPMWMEHEWDLSDFISHHNLP